MMSLDTIRKLNAQAARKAQREGIVPVTMTEGRLARFRERPHLPGFSFPFIGDRRPRGFTLVDSLLVDTSGFGADDEPALTPRQLAARLQVGMSYAVIECGQFQAVLGEFRMTAAAARKSAAQRGEWYR